MGQARWFSFFPVSFYSFLVLHIVAYSPVSLSSSNIFSVHHYDNTAKHSWIRFSKKNMLIHLSYMTVCVCIYAIFFYVRLWFHSTTIEFIFCFFFFFRDFVVKWYYLISNSASDIFLQNVYREYFAIIFLFYLSIKAIL